MSKGTYRDMWVYAERKGADVKESSLGAVPKANTLTTLPSGKSQSGAFSAAGANSTGSGGWIAFTKMNR